jgi:hypothetical protein
VYGREPARHRSKARQGEVLDLQQGTYVGQRWQRGVLESQCSPAAAEARISGPDVWLSEQYSAEENMASALQGSCTVASATQLCYSAACQKLAAWCWCCGCCGRETRSLGDTARQSSSSSSSGTQHALSPCMLHVHTAYVMPPRVLYTSLDRTWLHVCSAWKTTAWLLASTAHVQLGLVSSCRVAPVAFHALSSSSSEAIAV